jgi:branched-chain amino acid transport system permease protein
MISYWARKVFRDFRGEILELPTRTILFAAGILLFVLPLLTQDLYLLRVMTLAGIFAVFAASWDLLAGVCGQFSFGHTLFFAIAAYSSAMLNIHSGLPPVVTIPVGAILAVLAGLLLGLPGLRLKGPYFSLASLAFPAILLGVIITFPRFTGGELGLSGISRLGATRLTEYYISQSAMLILVLAIWKIATSKTGLIFHAIREDEIAVRASGINTNFYKMLAFSCSGLFAGLAGGMYAHFMRIAGPSTLDLILSLQIIVWTIVGGIATIYGPVIGVYLLYPLVEFLRVVPQLRTLTFALIVIVVLRVMPEGISSWVQDIVERECPRCKERNSLFRPYCRICNTELEHGKRFRLMKRGA